MKKETRRSILRYAIATAGISASLLVGILLFIGLDWLSERTELPIKIVTGVLCFIYLVWYVGKHITIIDGEE